jgi:anti-anti-sigma factor
MWVGLWRRLGRLVSRLFGRSVDRGKAGMCAVRSEQGWTVAELSGAIDAVQSGRLRAELRPWLRTATAGVVVNLRAVEAMDSTALATLVACRRELPAGAAGLRLCCANGRVQALLEVTGLDGVLEVYAGEAEALKAA